MELSIAALPPGSKVVVRTRTSNDAQSEEEVLASLGTVGGLGSWREMPALVGEPQPDAEASKAHDEDMLVPSGPGQYLQLQIELTGSGLSTPVIERLRIDFPRESLLQYLPAIYSKPQEQREFLERLLSIPQRTWTAIEEELDSFARFLDADSVPEHAIGWLAGLLGLTPEGTWTADQNRRLIRVLPSLRTTWGTPAGLRAWIRVYLANMGGIEIEELERAGVPGIVERFVDRRRLILDHPGAAALCAGGALWSPAVERRFQVGVFDREGEIELVSTGHPDGDLFEHYAHAFRVFVPASFVRTPADEALLRRAIDLQKPVHTTYELVLVEPRFRIGDQSTIDLDTVIGVPVAGPLLCAAVDDAPAREPYQRLNFDVTLGCGCGHREGHADGLERRLG
jgi:phage tail-like protein